MDAHGLVRQEDWQIDLALLRSSLRKLRGLCTHPQVGQLNRQENKLIKGKSANLKTISEVLEVRSLISKSQPIVIKYLRIFQSMREQGWRGVMDNRKARVREISLFSELVFNAFRFNSLPSGAKSCPQGKARPT